MTDFGSSRLDDALDDAVEIDLGDDDPDTDDQPEPGVDRVAREVRAELERGTFRDGGGRRRDGTDDDDAHPPARHDGGGPEAVVTPVGPDGEAAEAVGLGDAASELSERRSVETLYNARDAAAQALQEAPLLRREQGERAAAAAVHAAVAQFVRELEPILVSTDPGRVVWHDDGGAGLGSVRIPAPTPVRGDRFEIRGEPDLVDTSAPARLLRGDEIEIRCVRDYIDAGSPITATWRFEGFPADVYNPDPETRRDRVETPPPREVSARVYRQCSGVLSAAGMGVDVSEGEKSLWGPEDAEETI
jgi:hypothetical protein